METKYWSYVDEVEIARKTKYTRFGSPRKGGSPRSDGHYFYLYTLVSLAHFHVTLSSDKPQESIDMQKVR